jgi:hypothetical protein
MLKLPEFEHKIDCEPIGYPGITVTVWVNPPKDMEAAPAGGIRAALSSDSGFYRQTARLVRRVVVPGSYGQALDVTVATAKDLFDLEETPGFDPLIVAWALKQWRERRLEWLEAAAKNSASASGRQPGSAGI